MYLKTEKIHLEGKQYVFGFCVLLFPISTGMDVHLASFECTFTASESLIRTDSFDVGRLRFQRTTGARCRTAVSKCCPLLCPLALIQLSLPADPRAAGLNCSALLGCF